MSKLRGITGPLWVLLAAVSVAVSACGEDDATAPTVTGISTAKGGNPGGPGGGGPGVDATDPTGAPQDTTLDVRVLGSGFDDGSVAEFSLNGVATPKFRTNSTTFVNAGELVANVTIALDADTTLYDAEVTTTRGKKGVGADLFRVVKKGGGPITPPPDPAILINGNGGNSFDLGVLNEDGSNVTYFGVTAWDPAWSADGKKVVFYDAAVNTSFVADIVLDAQGGVALQNVLPLPAIGIETAWSPTEYTIAGSAGPDIYTVPATGGPATLVCASCGDYPTWSPDGLKLAFRGLAGTELLILTLATGQIDTLIPSGEFGLIHRPDWSRMGDQIAFNGYGPASPKRAMYIVEVETGVSRLLTTAGWPGTWSPDDSQVVLRNLEYRKGGAGGTGLLFISSATGAVLRHLKTTTSDRPDWRRCTPGPGCGPG